MSDEKAMARYEFKKKLEELRACRGRATELISLYVPPTRAIADVSNYLRNEYAQSSNIKSRTTRKNVMWAIDSILGRLKNYRVPPPNGVVFFVGNKSIGGDQTREVSIILEPPEPIQSFIYRCDSSFLLEPLERFLVEKENYGLIVLDRSECTIGWLKGSQIVPVLNHQSTVPSKHGRGGQSQQRFERLIEIAAHEWFVKIGDWCTEIFLEHISEMSGIFVGGPGYTKIYFLEQGFLHHELQKKVLGHFDTGYTNEQGLKELVDKASATMTSLKVAKEKNLMSRF
ncbi:MAG: peptide chain release factor aRF-1, partial [Thermoplasmata archaeon]